MDAEPAEGAGEVRVRRGRDGQCDEAVPGDDGQGGAVEEDRGGRAGEDEGGVYQAREVDPRGNAEEEVACFFRTNTSLEYRNTPG